MFGKHCKHRQCTCSGKARWGSRAVWFARCGASFVGSAAEILHGTAHMRRFRRLQAGTRSSFFEPPVARVVPTRVSNVDLSRYAPILLIGGCFSLGSGQVQKTAKAQRLHAMYVPLSPSSGMGARFGHAATATNHFNVHLAFKAGYSRWRHG